MIKRNVILGLCVMGIIAMITGCNSNGSSKGEYKFDESQAANFGEYAEGQELLCLAESQERAKEIADMYGIELVSYTNGVATFHTKENPIDVINRGIEKGYPTLELNQIMTID